MTTYRIFAETPHKDFPTGSVNNPAGFPVELISEHDAKWVVYLLRPEYSHVKFKIIDSHGNTIN